MAVRICLDIEESYLWLIREGNEMQQIKELYNIMAFCAKKNWELCEGMRFWEIEKYRGTVWVVNCGRIDFSCQVFRFLFRRHVL